MTDKKVFNDPIHGHIELDPLLVKIIDTPQFQRLRNLKQLGGAYFVYPGASHNRFEHSIGVCHLAGKLVKALKSRQPKLNITPQDVLCVQIAGLCHDLGHGPFSHLFDGMFIPEARKKNNQSEKQLEKWKHETASVEMFLDMLKSKELKEEMNKVFQNLIVEHQDINKEMASIKTMIEGLSDTNTRSGEGPAEESVKMFHNLVKKKQLEEPMKKIFLKEYKVLLDEDLVFKREMASIKKVIEGLSDAEGLAEESVKMFDDLVRNNKLKETMEKFFKHQVIIKEMVFIKEMIEGLPDTNKWSGEGRGEEKSFLYEIVSNKPNGIDVDKWDYFARDCHHLGIQNGFDYRRFIKFARVCEVNGRMHICIRDKEVANVYDMFHTRFRLHKKAYQHRVNKIIEFMISEAFLGADKHIKFTNSKGKLYTLSESVNDMEAYVKVTDHVFQQILNTEIPKDPKNPKDSEDFQKAKEILQNIQSRNLYRYLGETRPIQGAGAAQGGKSSDPKEMMITETMINEWKNELGELAHNNGLTKDDLVVLVSKFDYGMKEVDPVNNTYFYSKKEPDKAFEISREQVSKLLPTCFSEQLIRVYCKKTDDGSVEAATVHFKQWCQSKDFPVPQDGNSAEPEDENPGNSKKARKS